MRSVKRPLQMCYHLSSKYSQLSLSRLRLSRITTYLEETKLVLVLTQKSKIRSQNIVKKRSNFSPFPQYFQYIFLTKGVKLHSHLWSLVVRIVFSSLLQIWYVEVRISRSLLEGPFDFEIKRVDCTCSFATSYTRQILFATEYCLISHKKAEIEKKKKKKKRHRKIGLKFDRFLWNIFYM